MNIRCLALSFTFASALVGCADSPRVSVDGDIVLVDPPAGVHSSVEALSFGGGANGKKVLYLNFEGATVTPGFDEAEAGIADSNVITVTTVVPAFNATPYLVSSTRQQAIDAITANVKTFYSAYNVDVVSTRPVGPTFTMIMVGGNRSMFPKANPASLGLSPLDCTDAAAGNIGFVFPENISPGANEAASFFTIAYAIAHEAGHTYGLSHTTNMSDIMYPSYSPTATSFGGLAPIADMYCAQSVDSMKQQDTSALLAQNVGTAMAAPSGAVPVVQFVTPRYGSPMPSPYTLEFTADSPGGTLTKIELYNQLNLIQTFTAPPFTYMATGSTGASYAWTAKAYDANGNTKAVTINVVVDPAGTPPSGCSPTCNPSLACISGACAFSCVAVPCTGGLTCDSSGVCVTPTSGGSDGSMQSPTDGGAAQDGSVSTGNTGEDRSSGCDATGQRRAPVSGALWPAALLLLLGVSIAQRGAKRRGAMRG